MRLVIPHWVSHDGGAIYSIDCHPTEEKVLTCGQGDTGGTGLIMVWNMSPLTSEKASQNESVPKSLCMIRHQAGANCVRWSPDGVRFAVASDDSNVTVYEFSGRVQSAGSVMGKSAASVERYKECAVLRSHNMEVLCVEWSANRKYLASSSIDNQICVWNAKKLHEKVATLLGHQGAVKGLSWDPIGKYLASLSSDKSLRLWKTDNWQCDTIVQKPFEGSSETTMFSRLDWSPDGQYLLSPTSTNNEGPTTQIIERQTWDTSRDLVGHRKATSCVRVLPRLLSYTDYRGVVRNVTCLAVGSRDKSVSIWLIPKAIRPVLVIHRLFKHTVMDMSWKGLNLAICSQDGTMVMLSFTEKQLGAVLANSAMGDVCEKLYRIRPVQYEENGDDASHQQQMGGIDENSMCGMDVSMNASFAYTPAELVARKKKEADAKLPTTFEAINMTSPIKETETDVQARTKEKALMEKRNKQVEEETNGKRRIQPIFLGSTAAPVEAPTPAPAAASVAQTQVQKPIAKRIVPVSEPLKKVQVQLREDPDAEDIDVSSNDEEEEADDEAEDDESSGEDEVTEDEQRRKRKRKRDAGGEEEEVAMTERRVLAADFTRPAMRPVELTSVKVVEGSTILDAPQQQVSFKQHVLERKALLLDVDNKWKCAGVEATCVKLVKNQRKKKVVDDDEAMEVDGDDQEREEGSTRTTKPKVQWQVVISAPVVIAAANKHWCVLGCGDRCLRVLSLSDGTTRVCLQLDALPVHIGVNEHACYALTQTGKLSTWDLQKLTAIVVRQAIFECVSQDSSLNSFTISEKGIPLIAFSTGNVFTFSTQLQCWQLVDSTSQTLRLSASIDCNRLTDGPLGRLVARIRRPGTVSSVPVSVSRAVKESQLEQWLQSAEALGNGQDYKTMLTLYAEQLCEYGNEKKLRSLLSRLSGVASICGLRRAALRDDVMRMIESRQPQLATTLSSTQSLGGEASKKISLF